MGGFRYLRRGHPKVVGKIFFFINAWILLSLCVCSTNLVFKGGTHYCSITTWCWHCIFWVGPGAHNTKEHRTILWYQSHLRPQSRPNGRLPNMEGACSAYIASWYFWLNHAVLGWWGLSGKLCVVIYNPRLSVYACRRTDALFVYNRKLIVMNSINLSKKWSGQSRSSRTGSYAYGHYPLICRLRHQIEASTTFHSTTCCF